MILIQRDSLTPAPDCHCASTLVLTPWLPSLTLWSVILRVLRYWRPDLHQSVHNFSVSMSLLVRKGTMVRSKRRQSTRKPAGQPARGYVNSGLTPEDGQVDYPQEGRSGKTSPALSASSSKYLIQVGLLIYLFIIFIYLLIWRVVPKNFIHTIVMGIRCVIFHKRTPSQIQYTTYTRPTSQL